MCYDKEKRMGDYEMRKFILGTDWWTDCDDAVAVRVLTRAMKSGEIQLLGIGLNACLEYSAASMDAFLCGEEVRGIPIGLDADATDFAGVPSYQEQLVSRAEKYHSNADAEDAVRLYRRLLAEAEDPIEIIEIGFMQVIAGVLQSGPDEFSEKNGIELFREKVAKVWAMAGKWDKDGETEHNFCNNARSRKAGEIFCRLCPVPVTFLGFEVGFGVISGSRLSDGDNLYRVMCDHGSPNGRHSWDPMTALMAVIGDEEKAGYDVVQGTASVDPLTGQNHFTRSAEGMHRYVIKKKTDRWYADAIDAVIG